MTALRDQLIKFIAALRSSSIRISVAESIDAMNAVAAAGLAREKMREALAAALIKDEADRAAFDESFEHFFAAPHRVSREHPSQPGQRDSAASGPGRPGENPSPQESKAVEKDSPPRESGRPRDATREECQESPPPSESPRRSPVPRSKDSDHLKAAEQREAGCESDPRQSQARADSSTPGIDAARLARIRAIERMPFEKFSDLDYDEARDALAPLVRRFKIRLGRRLRRARAGKIDFRRTIRAGLQRGGALIELNFRARRPRHVDLVILADVSGSVRYAAQLMLELVAGARECFRRVTSFAYVDHLAEADFEDRHLVMEPALDLYARSDFGRVLGELWQRRAGLLTRATVVVIMGDGRNNRLPARADLIREIAGRCRAVVWLNPEDPARWGAGDSAIRQYAREVTALAPSRNLRELHCALLKIA